MSDMTSGGNYMPNRHQPQSREYRPCLTCGQPTWASNQICTSCDESKQLKKKNEMASRRKLAERSQ